MQDKLSMLTGQLIKETLSLTPSEFDCLTEFRNENANKNYSLEFMERLMNEEGKGAFSCRSNRLGHMQEGHNPSPYDRNYASKLGVRAGQWIVNEIKKYIGGDSEYSTSYDFFWLFSVFSPPPIFLENW